ncbi:lipopolysaccharide biosynthesis protein [Rippkaea orientalis PCC 8801]|uniref:Lipopolysaccharide biosynthesis protein n=1 Tax=Rippkaea orientalis (strain PCC 8801 / RF-1) TaxID=41431 RepID=B7K3Y2_RIPO1|nr:tyrosine-protein kinase domain-containing protein [Rippkaea orientalis]ACK66522.1 lipopolysaccharide biosynthesis protein [Rippkaea orientalis PCC 8801]
MAPPIVTRFLISFEQNKWLGFLTFLTALGISGVVAVQPPPPPPPPTYKAIGQLSFRKPPPAFTTTGTELQAQGRSISKEMLLSEPVLRGAMDKLQLNVEEIRKIRDENLKIVLPGEEKEDKEAETSPSQAILLEYTDKQSPTRSTLILETLMKEMVDYSRWLNTSELRSRIEGLTTRLAQVQKDLTAAENRFYRYISKEGSDLLAIQDGSLFSGITSAQQRQRELQLALQEVEGRISSLTNQLGLTPKQAYSSVALSADPIIANLRARIVGIELQLERDQLDLKKEHPKIVKLLKEKKVSETLLKQRAQELMGAQELAPLPLEQIRQDSSLDPQRQQLANQLLALQTQREGLVKQLQSVITTEKKLREEYEKFPNKQLQQAQLVQAVEFQRIVYQNILTALVDAQSAEAETVGSLTIALPPTYQPSPPYSPERRNRLLTVLAGGGIGIVAGAGVILLLALIDNRLHTAQELRDSLSEREVPLLGQLPFIYTSLLREDESPVLLDADASDLGFYERFRSNLRRLTPDTSNVILITSISNEEGKSVTAYNLAIASAHAGKRTLLVEADLRAPSKAKWLEVTPDSEASVEPLRYYGDRTGSIQLVPGVTNLYILPSPGSQRQAAAIIESSELQLVLKDVRGRFDLVIIDSPSLSRCNDALLLEPLTDGLVLVTRPGYTRSSLLNETIDQFTEAEVPVIGAVINAVEDLVPPEPSPSVSEVETDEEKEEEKEPQEVMVN